MIKIQGRIVDCVDTVSVSNDKKVVKLEFCRNVQLTELLSLADCDVLSINYQNSTVRDRYIVTDLAIDGDMATFSWTLGANATAKSGKTAFVICAQRTDGNGHVLQEWHTILAEFRVYKSLKCAVLPARDQQDLFAQLLSMTNSKLDKNQGSENAGKVMTVDTNGELVPMPGGGGSVDFDDTITQNAQTGKYGIDFSIYNSQEASWASDGKAVKSNDINAWKFLLSQSLGREFDAINTALNGKQPSGNYALKSEIPNVANETGISTTAVMSQKAVTDNLANKQNTLSIADGSVNYLGLDNDTLGALLGRVVETQNGLIALNGLISADHLGTWISSLKTTISRSVSGKQDKAETVTLTTQNTVTDNDNNTLTGFFVEDNKDYIGGVAFSELAIAFGGIIIDSSYGTPCHHSTLLFKTASAFTSDGIQILTDATDVVLWHGDPVTFETDTLYELDFRCETIDNVKHIIIAGGACNEQA